METIPLRRDIRKPAAVGVVQPLPSVAELGEVLADGGVLVARPRPGVAEAAAGKVDGFLGLDVQGAADGGDVRAGGGEDGKEAGRVFAVVGLELG